MLIFVCTETTLSKPVRLVTSCTVILPPTVRVLFMVQYSFWVVTYSAVNIGRKFNSIGPRKIFLAIQLD